LKEQQHEVFREVDWVKAALRWNQQELAGN